jgi:hypothetical protein
VVVGHASSAHELVIKAIEGFHSPRLQRITGDSKLLKLRLEAGVFDSPYLGGCR